LAISDGSILMHGLLHTTLKCTHPFVEPVII